MHADLLDRARDSMAGKSRPRAVYLRRAVSDAYYAVFHRLAMLCADQLVGTINQRNGDAWRSIYRSLDHGQAKRQFKTEPAASGLSVIATAFVQLQEARHEADYNPSNLLRKRADAESFILLAESAIQKIDGLGNDQRRDLAVRLLFNRKRV
jgi:uncharacterized protein (UPF0332 family)